MNKVIHRNESYWGRSSVVVLAGGFALAMVSVLSDDPDVAVIHDLMVHESRRGSGLGSRLLKEAISEAEKTGAGVTRIAVEPGTWQEGWYRSMGFVETGHTDIAGRDVLVLERRNPQ